MTSSPPGAFEYQTAPRPRGQHRPRRVVLVGDSNQLAPAMLHPGLAAAGTLAVIGTVPTTHELGAFPHEEIRRFVRQDAVDTIVLVGAAAGSSLARYGELAIILDCDVLSFSVTGNGATPCLRSVWDSDRDAKRSAPTAYPRRRFDRAKRGVDLVLSSVGLLVASPVIALVAIAVRLDSKGDAFFGHVRIGRGGQRFRCWKLRTMHVNAERRLTQDHALLADYRANDFKLPDERDPRITRIGRFLRKTSLDELPQLLNVLVGEMSIVGPRPIIAEELAHYPGEVLTLLAVRPGITGAWAVSGRHHLPYPERAAVELEYVRNRSFLIDLLILVRTIGAVLDPGFGRRVAPPPAPGVDSARAVAAPHPVPSPQPVRLPHPVADVSGDAALG